MPQNLKVRDRVMLIEQGSQGWIWGLGDSGKNSDQVILGDS